MTTYNVSSGQSISGLTLNSGDDLFVSVGGVVSGIAVNGGNEIVYAGGIANGAMVNDGGAETIYAGGVARGTMVNSGGGDNVSSGGVVSGPSVSSDGEITVYAGGVAIGAMISNGGTEAVSSGGVVSGTLISSGGNVTVYAGGIASGTAASRGDQYLSSGGVARGTVLNNGGQQYVSSGGVASGTVVNGVGATYEFVFGGGVASGTVVNDGGAEVISSGGVADGAVVNFGFETVYSGGMASGTVVTSGGEDIVFSGGRVSGSQVNGGLEYVSSGGVAIGTVAEGFVYVTFFTSEPQFVDRDGNQIVYSGGVASGTVVDNLGQQYVSSGGAATGSVVSSGGIETVYAGGLAGGTVVSSGGIETIFVGGVASGIVLNGGGSIDLPDFAYSSGGSVFLNGQTDILTITEGGSSYQQQLAGKYTDATFQVSTDGGDGTLISVTGTVVPLAMVLSAVALPSTGDLPTGSPLTLTITMSEAVAVSGGTPTLTLNDGGIATYVAARSTPTTLVFDYTVQSGQSTTALAITGFNATGATVQDAAGNSANFAGLLVTFAGLAINIVLATVQSVVASPSTGDLTTGALVTLTVIMSNTVTVSGGTPSLTLNDGGTATYDAAKSSGTTLVFDYTVQSGQSTTALAITGFNANGAIVEDTTGNNASFTGASTATFSGLEVNVSPSSTITAAYAAILRTQPSTAQLNETVAQIEAGQTTLAKFETGLIASEQAIYSTLPALVTIDAFYNATPSSTVLTTVATATSGTTYYTAAELHNLGYSDPNVWTILGAGWGADPGSNFHALYDGDATGTAAGYTAFINAAYQTEFGAQPSAASLQNLLGDIPGLAALLSGGGNSASPIQIMGGLYGYLLYVGQTNGIGHFASAADAFLQAAANGTVTYGPELTAEFPSSTGATTASAMSETPTGTAPGTMAANTTDPNVITVTGSNHLIDPGAGDYTIQFLAGSGDDTLVLHTSSVDQVSGFNPGADVLDVSLLLTGTGLDLTGTVAGLSNYLTVVDQETDALLQFNPTGRGGGSTVAVLHGLGSTVTGLSALIADGAIRFTPFQ